MQAKKYERGKQVNRKTYFVKFSCYTCFCHGDEENG